MILINSTEAIVLKSLSTKWKFTALNTTKRTEQNELQLLLKFMVCFKKFRLIRIDLEKILTDNFSYIGMSLWKINFF